MISKIIPLVWGTHIWNQIKYANPGDTDHILTEVDSTGSITRVGIMKFDARADTVALNRISEVKLWVNVSSGNGVENRIYISLRDVIANCSWNWFNVPSQYSWYAPGASGTGDKSGTAMGARSLLPGKKAISISPADYVAWRIDSVPLILYPKSGSSGTTMITLSSNAPYLEVLYRPATSGIIMF